MTIARQQQVDIHSTPYYHCMARCVRRAFLCGDDHFSGKNYDHRKQWIVDKLKQLAGIFAIDICAYAVMSNHYHVILRVNDMAVDAWSDNDIIDRWYCLFNGNVLVDRYQSGEPMSKAELDKVQECITEWRERLMDISWFMRCLNEAIAREANKEDNCKGRFWEGRFKSQALLDEAALLTCMMYVDLNPVRAGIAKTPEKSDFTSIQERIQQYSNKKQSSQSIKKSASKAKIKESNVHAKTTEPMVDIPLNNLPLAALLPFDEKAYSANTPVSAIPFSFNDYMKLIDWTGRAVRDDKTGSIPNDIAPILNRLGINDEEWLNSVKYYGRRFQRVVGAVESVKRFSAQLDRQWLQGIRQCQRLYSV